MTMSTIKRLITATAVVALAAFVSGCGGGGAGAQGGAGGGGGGATEASALTLITSVPSIGSDGKTVATITAFVKDSGNRALANQIVDFSTTDGGAVITSESGGLLRTGATGSVSVMLAITDPTNRVINVAAKSGSLTSTLGIDVAGTELTLNGPTNLVANTPTEFAVALRNAAGNPIAGRVVAVTSSSGNTLSQAALTTDATGRAKFHLTGVKVGADTIRIAALGATASLGIVVASAQQAAQVVFSAPSAKQELEVGGLKHAVSVTYQVGGVPQPGRTVAFSSTRGEITASATTDATGRASAEIWALTVGLSTITARVVDDGIEGRQDIEFVSRVPAKISVQSNPTNVGVNLTQSGTKSSQLLAVVKDANDNPVKGQVVDFSEVTDPSNGRIEPPSATTDRYGVASVAFFPGANPTGEQAIELKASLPGKGISGTTKLTARQELDVSIGTGNKLEVPDLVSYVMPWAALVTDGSSNGVRNAVVEASLVAVRFSKGFYSAGDTHWEAGVAVSCPTEDSNGNLRLDPGEDTNDDGELTPGNVAAVRVLSEGGRTDDSGFARIEIKYPKQYGNWVIVRLTVKTTVIGGTEGTATQTFSLPVVSDDVKLDQNPPGGINSPFGVTGDCSTRN